MTAPLPRIRVDDTDPTPAFEQIRRQIVAHIASGALPVGAKLPPLRQLARDLGVAVNTAGHAYRLLDETGLIVSRRGGGTRVAKVPDEMPTETPSALAEAASSYLDAVTAAGASHQEALEAVLAAIRRRQ
ncbi:GntR family transcriptional regulator [Gordonia phthalatica]|uniref:HTH gntR-type domain-containing protein n=1 Tax=Gordonia phthalatica TaxID=1136941 RepID=A0A0N7FUD5_9ACTN|nr:GntR family transcriptional regulator [Gordonia phthalatica]ALG84055.1 hypothetical protein ACH46_05455 [Gordonia phthalatica]